MKVVFIGGFYPKEHINQIRILSKGAIANANNILQWGFIDGLKCHLGHSSISSLQLISVPQIGAFPFKYKKIFFSVEKKKTEKDQCQIKECCSFINVIGFKHFSRYLSLKRKLRKMSTTFNNEKILIIIYDLQVEFLKSILSLKNQFPNLKVCLIVPDLHGYTGSPKNFAHNTLEKIERKQLNKLYKYIDSYVLISKFMIEKLPVGDKPWVLIEGIYNFAHLNSFININNVIQKRVFYSGAMDKRNGVHNLIKAFTMINDPEFRLILCGDGPLRSEIENAANHDKRIEYKGQLDHSDVLLFQKESNLLVNPRLPEEEFTKYSFPSKTMEYFASGVPVLMYKLAGVPEEYYNYCYTPLNETVEELKKSIINICNSNPNSLKILGEKAYNFVAQQKNSEKQVGIMLDMTSKLFKNEITFPNK